MSVKVAMPRDIESSFNSSIPMPDATIGEVEWQDEGGRTVAIGPLSIPLILIDSVYVNGYGLYTLSGNKTYGYKITRFNDDGVQINQVSVPVFTSAQDTDSENKSLSYDEIESRLMVGRSVNSPVSDPSSVTWTFDFQVVSLDLSSQYSLYIGLDFGYKDYGAYSEFKFKTDGSRVTFLAVDKDDPYGEEISRELALFRLSDMSKISSIIDTFSDFCMFDGDVYCLMEEPFISSGKNVSEVTVFDSDFKIQRKIKFNWPFDVLFGGRISSAKSLITLSVENREQNTLSQVFDSNMINIGSYRLNDEVIKSSTKRKYRCAVEATFDDPELGVELSPPTWVDIGSVNKYAVLNSSTSQRSIFNGGGFVSCSITEPVDTVGIFGLSGVQSATVSVIDGGSTLYTETKSGMDSEFSDVEIRDIVFSVPPFNNVTIRVDFTGSNVRVGRFAVGISETIGRAVAGTELGDIDYSILEFDEFGNTRYVPRPIVSYHTFQVDVAKQKSLSVARKLRSIGGEDAIWSADVGLSEPLVAIGKCERFPITYDNPTIVSYTVKVRGTA